MIAHCGAQHKAAQKRNERAIAEAPPTKRYNHIEQQIADASIAMRLTRSKIWRKPGVRCREIPAQENLRSELTRHEQHEAETSEA